LTTHSTLRGRGLRTVALAACITSAALVAAPSTNAQTAPPEDGGTEQAAAAPTAAPAVVSTTRVVPKRRRVVRRRFDPWARPSPAKVRRIIQIEARRWGIDPGRLARRVACESRYQWAAGNGPYYGLLQFHPSTFSRGVRSLGTRRVAFRRVSWRRVRGRTVSRYSDGHVERERHRPRRQRVVTIYRGKLPRRPGITHAWTQLRIGAQAIRGISGVSSSEWGCPA
jgi:hypothetical protein